jgi:hypothetical protein
MAAILIFNEKKKIIRAVFVVAGLAIVYFILDPSRGLFPKCPFYWLTGYKCPGCGSQRAVHELLHLHFAAAFKENALLVTSIPYILLGFFFDYTNLGQLWPRVRKTLFGLHAIIVIAVIVISWWIFRNI